MPKPIKKRPEKIALRIDKGCLIPADSLSLARLKAKKFNKGDLVFAVLSQPRNPKFHRLAHQFGTLVAENIEQFEGMNCHNVLKRLQIESGVGCEEVSVLLQGMNVLYRIPISLSFESLDEGEFHELISGLCHHVSKTYWPTLSAEAIENMASAMVD